MRSQLDVGVLLEPRDDVDRIAGHDVNVRPWHWDKPAMRLSAGCGLLLLSLVALRESV